MNNQEKQDILKKTAKPVKGYNWKNRYLNKNNLITCVFLFIILFSAFALRYKGIKFGLPIAPHFDETTIVEQAATIVKSKDLNPHFFKYPSLYIYMQASLLGIKNIVDKTATNYSSLTEIEKSTIYFIGRLLTLIFSMGTIFIVYTIGRLLFDRTSGFLSIIFMSVSFLHVDNSYRITVDSPMVFWVTLSFLMSVLIFVKGPKLKYYIFNGIFIGLAIGTKYTGFIAFIPLLYAHLYANSFSISKFFNRKIIIAVLLIMAAFVVSTPYSILDVDHFTRDILAEARHYSIGHPGHESRSSTSYGAYFSLLLTGFGIIPIIISFLGILYLFLTNRLKAILLLLFPLFFFIFLGKYKVYFQRNLLALIPFLSIFSGFLLATTANFFSRDARYLATKLRDKKIFHIFSEKKTYLFIMLLLSGLFGIYGIYQQGAISYRHVKIISLPETRWVSTKWMDKNIPPGSKIALEHYTPRPDRRLFNVYFLGVGGLSKRKNLEKFDFLVASSSDYGRFFRNREKYKKRVEIYKQIFKKFKLVKEFKANNVDVTGPTIRILKVN